MQKTSLKTFLRHWRLLTGTLSLLATGSSVDAVPVRLAWETNSEPNITGYRLYCGRSTGNYDTIIEVGNTNRTEVQDLTHGSSYFFVVTAVNTAGLESEPSNEVVHEPLLEKLPPTAIPQSLTLLEDGSLSLTLTGTSPSGTPLSVAIVQGPTYGTLSGAAPKFTYLPPPNFHGSDELVFTVSDGSLTSAPASVQITVQPVNDRPVATPVSLTVTEGGSVPVPFLGTDIDSPTLTPTLTRPPQKGVFVGQPPNVVYHPTVGFTGTDSAEFTVSDGQLVSAPALITLTVLPGAKAPVALPLQLTVAEEGTVAFTLAGQSSSGSALKASLLTQPINGSIRGLAPDLSYRPNLDFNGTEVLEYVVTDGTLTSPPARITITVTPVNDAPSVRDSAASTPKNRPVTIPLPIVDSDSTEFSLQISRQTVYGTLSGDARQLIYTPKSGFVGTDFFRYTVTDGALTSGRATVTIEVLDQGNSAPVALAASLAAVAGESTSLVLAGSDPDQDSLSFLVTGGPVNGKLIGTAPNLTYQANAGYSGPDAVTFVVSDGQLQSEPATVSITVTTPNRAPVANPASISVAQGGSAPITLSGSDPDGDTLTSAVTAPPKNGTLSGTAPNFTYRPNAGFVGSDTISFTVSDGKLTSATATISIQVTGENQAPVAVAMSVTLSEDGILPIVLSGSDPNGDTLTYRVVTATTLGNVSGTAPNLLYTPKLHRNGTDTLQYTVSDGKLTSTPATVTINILPVNDAPVARPFTISIESGASLSFNLDGHDPDAKTLKYVVTQRPTLGALRTLNRNMTFMAPENYSGTLTLEYTVSDEEFTSAPAIVTIQVTAPAPAPAPVNHLVLVTQGGSTALPVSGAVSLTDAPLHGVVELLPDGTPAYRHFGGTELTDAFTYSIANSDGSESVGSVDVRIFTITHLALVGSAAELDFTVAAGMTYRVETTDASDLAQASWTTLNEFQADSDGIATITDGAAGSVNRRAYRVRAFGTFGELVSEIWGLSTLPLTQDGPALPLPITGAALRVSTLAELGADTLVLEGAPWTARALEARGAFPTHAVVVIQSATTSSAGLWWPIVNNDAANLLVDTRGADLRSLLQPGDRLEVRRLLTVAETFGASEPASARLPLGTLLGIQSADSASSWVLEYGLTTANVPAYFAVTPQGKSAPDSGAQLTFLPGQSVSLHPGSTTPVSLTLAGRLAASLATGESTR